MANKLGRRLAAARVARGLSRRELAARSGVSVRRLGRISVEDLERVAALRLPVAHFLEACALCGDRG